MTRLKLFLAGIVLAVPVPAQTTFANTYSGTGTQTQGYALQQTSDGGYIAAGISTDTATQAESAWVLKLDSSGAVTWQNLYGAAGISGQLVSVEQTSDSGYILAGNANSAAWVMKLDSSGGLTWSEVLSSPETYTYFYSIQQTPDGGFIAAGRNGTEAWLVKLDSTGDSTWQMTYNPYNAGAFGQFFGVTLTSDGGYAAAGNLANGAFVVKTDSSGNPQWQNLYVDFYDTSANSIQQTSDGGYIVGASFDFGNESTTYNRAAVMKLNSTGSVTWQQTFSLTKMVAPDTAASTDDGDVSAAIVSVVRQIASGGYVFLTSRALTNATYTSIAAGLDANGAVLWQNGFKTGVAGTYATSIDPTSDGGYAVTGVTLGGPSNRGFVVLKLNQLGQVPLCAAVDAPSALLGTGIESTVTPESAGVQSAAATAGTLAVSVTATAAAATDLCHL